MNERNQGDLMVRHIVTRENDESIVADDLEDAYFLATLHNGKVKEEQYREMTPDTVFASREILVERREEPSESELRRRARASAPLRAGGELLGGKTKKDEEEKDPLKPVKPVTPVRPTNEAIHVVPGTEAIDPAAIQAEENRKRNEEILEPARAVV